MTVHDFEESLSLSQEHADGAWWMDVYRAAFPDLVGAVSVRDDGWAQRGGIDRVLTLQSGKTFTVDEKVRKEDWPDILLEYWSNYERRIPGWVAKDLACDYIAYAMVPSQTCHFLPFHLLRQAWRKNRQEWVGTYRRVEAKNKTYTTISVPVPTQVLLDSLRDSMTVTWQ